MKLPLSLLKSFIDLDLTLNQIQETLTLLGIEVDAIQHARPPFAKVVVGEVLSAKRHPNAEKLQVAEVSDGEKTYQVVCGAPNCRPGIKTAFAHVGALLTDSKGQSFQIEKASLRGVESFGMLCSEAELHLSEDHAGIMELPEEFQAGQDLVALLWDPVLELSLTPNLGYCLSARGIAKELSAALNLPMKEVGCFVKEEGPAQTIQVEMQNSTLCPRYMGRSFDRVHVGPSPFWLQKILKAAGMRPIHNAVDITNYILLKWGQPMHAFDANLLEENKLHVSLAQKEFPFECLDGATRTVPIGTLLISDGKQPVALAGIMGGANTAVSEKTQQIFLEAAYFDPMTVRVASKKMDLRSESSIRFEKGTDPVAIPEALEEACALFNQLCGARLCTGLIDLKKGDFAPKAIRCRTKRVQKILGAKISLNEIREIFHRLQFKTALLEEETLEVFVPVSRFDLTQEIDLIEEVARIYGYNKIEKAPARCTTAQIPHDPRFVFERTLRTRLVGLGLQEIITCDLISPKLSEITPNPAQCLKVLHSKSEEYSILRPSLLPGFLEVIRTNLDQKNSTLSGFEIGRIHFAQEEKPIEVATAAVFLTGKAAPHHWDQKPSEADFYDLKGILENLFEGLHLESISFKPSRHPSFHPSRQASIYAGAIAVGSLGEVHPRLLEKLDIKQKVLYAELDLEELLPLQPTKILMKALPQFPASERDWTLPLPKESLLQPLFDAIQKIKSPLLEKTELLDVFMADTKNVTFRFTYRDPFKTVSYEEVEKEHTRIMEEVSAKLRT